MEITELVHKVQLLSQEAGLAVNTERKEEAKEKLLKLSEVLGLNTGVFISDEPDSGPAPGETEEAEQEAAVEETPAEPGPEAQPSEE